MTDAAGVVAWERQAKPFGETLIIAGLAGNPSRIPGQYFDAETGLHQNGFRDYDPSTGRYLQSDSIGLEDGLNTYAYVSENPINSVEHLD